MTTTLIDTLARATADLVHAPVEAFGPLAQTLSDMEAELSARSDRALAEGQDARAARLAIDAGQAAIRAGIAAKALRTGQTHAGDAQVVAINRALALTSVLDAGASLGRMVAGGGFELDFVPSSSVRPELVDGPGAPGASTGSARTVDEVSRLRQACPEHGRRAQPERVGEAALDTTIPTLLNICQHHREHERFYVHERTAAAADLYREATKLKIVAEAWQRNAPVTPDPAIDWRHPSNAPAGCTDLNALDAIGMIGVLFMEGDGEPIEIRVLNAKLTALAAAWRRAGEWLSAKMDAAWERERAMYQQGRIAVAHQRFNTIAMNWRGSRERLLGARALEMALRVMDTIPFDPPALRQDLHRHGLALAQAAAILAAAAQLVARTAADLAHNDSDWTDCIRHLEHTITT